MLINMATLAPYNKKLPNGSFLFTIALYFVPFTGELRLSEKPSYAIPLSWLSVHI